jgi:hypothetical protein
MPLYRILYLRDSQVDRFRNAPPREKPYHLRVRNYDEGEVIESSTPYAVWKQLQECEEASDSKRPFGVGDVLQSDESELLVLNYWGFDEARWQTPEENAADERLQALAASTGAESSVNEAPVKEATAPRT